MVRWDALEHVLQHIVDVGGQVDEYRMLRDGKEVFFEMLQNSTALCLDCIKN